MLENGLSECPCIKKKCARHGKCSECMEYHRLNKRHPPYCKRKADKAADKKARKKQA